MNKITNWTNLLTVMFLAMVALPTDVWADTKQTYIKKVTIASRGSSKDAINDLTNAGYQIMPKDLNANAGGDYIYQRHLPH